MEDTSNQPNPKVFVDRFFDALNRRDWDAFSALVAEDFSWTEPMLGDRVGSGRESYLRDVKSFVRNVPDANFVVGNLFAEGNRAAFELTIERKQSNVKATIALFQEVNEAGRLHKMREHYDTKMLMKQLGLGSE